MSTEAASHSDCLRLASSVETATCQSLNSKRGRGGLCIRARQKVVLKIRKLKILQLSRLSGLSGMSGWPHKNAQIWAPRALSSRGATRRRICGCCFASDRCRKFRVADYTAVAHFGATLMRDSEYGSDCGWAAVEVSLMRCRCPHRIPLRDSAAILTR